MSQQRRQPPSGSKASTRRHAFHALLARPRPMKTLAGALAVGLVATGTLTIGSPALDSIFGQSAGATAAGATKSLGGQGRQRVAPGRLTPDRSGATRQSATRAQAGSARTAEQARTPVTFRIGTVNLLSSWHSYPGRGMSWMGPGPLRAHWAAEAMRAYNPAVVGLQEVWSDQIGVLAAEMPNYGFYPGNSQGLAGVTNNIMWNRVRFTKTADGSKLLTVLGQRRAIHWVRLRDRATQRQFWVLNVHNSPNRGGSQTYEAERRAQVRAEVKKLQELGRGGLPVLLTGDMNDKKWTYCYITRHTDLRAPQGGGACSYPRNMHIEWIFGSKTNWSNFKYDRGPLVARTTDHHVMFATATLR